MQTLPCYDDFPPYTPIEPYDVLSRRLNIPIDQIIKLDANENPYGASPAARQALTQLAYAHIYPDPESRALRAKLAAFTGVPMQHILAGSGADELIDLICRVTLQKGDKVLICPPTFGMYAFSARVNQAGVISVPRLADMSLDLAAIQAVCKAEQPKIIFATSPNNPDGRLMTAGEIDMLLELPALIVLDEAYIEFADGTDLGANISRMEQVLQRDNLIVLRTFSKWAGLAGLRVGYGAFPQWMLPAIWKIKQPYNVNVAAQVAAIASLDDCAWLAENINHLRVERQRLLDGLSQISLLSPYPTQSNFILCRVNGMAALSLKNTLMQSGILIRHYNTAELQDCIRISVGKPAETDAVLLALQQIAAGEAVTRKLMSPEPRRTASIQRKTNETSIALTLNLDGSGRHDIHSGIDFLDHMLSQIAVHGLFDLSINATGDLAVDAHHTMEDIALALGMAFNQALGERKGIARCGWAVFPMDETKAEVAIDFSGRAYCTFDCNWQGSTTGGIPNSLWQHFFESFAQRAACTLHMQVPYGRDDHHKIEALFKALARALDLATSLDARRSGLISSSKGTVNV